MADDAGRPPHRTWPERLAITATFATAVVCFLVAAALVFGYVVVRQRNVVELDDPPQANGAAAAGADPIIIQPTTSAAPASAPATPATTASPRPTTTDEVDATGANSPTSTVHEANDTTAAANRDTTSTDPPSTFPEADPEALNFLVTGADNGACIDPDSPYAGAFGDREGMGERSDTIMVLRVDPEANRVAVLSFPRDLYVEIADTGNMSRINSAYQQNEPQRLIDTIYNNFGIPIDHYIQVDFCAFKTLVDAVGGVAVPFEFPARDENTGLNIPTSGCHVLDGEHALAYVRSRHYEYEDPEGSGNWTTDPSSDLGRISRQQDFLRRTLSTILDEGPLNPRVARGMIRAATDYVVTDRGLTPARMMEFAGVMNDVDPTSVLSYQIEASGRSINGAAVLIPNTDGANMQQVLALFRGETSLADAPVQVFEQTTTLVPRQSTTTAAPASSVPRDSTPGTAAAQPAGFSTAAAGSEPPDSSIPAGPQEVEFGIVPPRNVTC
jgi:LCP family protein required for cell wall assembly